MLWTPSKIAAIRDRAAAAARHLAENEPATMTVADIWKMRGFVVGSVLMMWAAAEMWSRALALVGAPALRPLHRVLADLIETMNDPPLKIEE